MKILIWVVFAALALLGTGAVALLAALVDGTVALLAAGGTAEVARVVADWSLPEWLSPWWSPADAQVWIDALAAALRAADGWLPGLGALLGWVVPLLWAAWGLCLLTLLALAAGLHVWVGRSAARRDPAAA